MNLRPHHPRHRLEVLERAPSGAVMGHRTDMVSRATLHAPACYLLLERRPIGAPFCPICDPARYAQHASRHRARAFTVL